MGWASSHDHNNYHITLAIILLCSLFVETKTESPFLLFWCEVNYPAPLYLIIIQTSPTSLFTGMAQLCELSPPTECGQGSIPARYHIWVDFVVGVGSCLVL